VKTLLLEVRYFDLRTSFRPVCIDVDFIPNECLAIETVEGEADFDNAFAEDAAEEEAAEDAFEEEAAEEQAEEEAFADEPEGGEVMANGGDGFDGFEDDEGYEQVSEGGGQVRILIGVSF